MKPVCVILITKDRPKLFEQTVRSLFKNTPRELFDLIVVDDGSEEIEYRKAKYNHDHGFYPYKQADHLILTDFKSPSICRNLGMEIAARKRYKYVYHSDNDMYFLPGWLEKCIDLKENQGYKNLTIIGPYCHPFLQENNDILDNKSEDFYTVDANSGNSWFIETKDYMHYGLIEHEGIMNSEDWEMCQRIRKDGKLCVALREKLVLHCGITNSRGEPSVGADLLLNELSAAKTKYGLDIYYE
jgi:glycosyltransferase involved in cell wall biosynthesis